MWTGLRRALGSDNTVDLRDLESRLEDSNASWDPLYLKSQMWSVEEYLHLQLIWQRVLRVWATLGTGTLWALAIISEVLEWFGSAREVLYLYVGAAFSTIVAPLVVYIQYKRTRRTRLFLRKLNMLHREKVAERDGAGEGDWQGTLRKQKRYREEAFDVIAQLREQANRNRRIHNRFQIVIIVGSIFASAITTASVSFGVTRWISVGVTAAVGLAAGFTGYFKFHEHSYNLQQTADAIERECEAVELRVGKYHALDDGQAYSAFAEAVERLRDEQNKRQQQLDQPVEVKRDDAAAAV